MRTTLDLDDALLARAKAEAARQRTTLTRLIEEALALRLAEGERERPARPFRVRVFAGDRGFRPGIDPMRNGSLLDAPDIEWERRQAGLEPLDDGDDREDDADRTVG